jgi:peptide deformylase
MTEGGFGIAAFDIERRLQKATSLSGGAGMAAPQLGMNLRMFSWAIKHTGEQGHIINPRIVESTNKRISWNEGCLSIPDFWFDIERPEGVVIEGRDIEGDQVVFVGSGFLGRLFQHEIDHLDGVLSVDHLDEKQLEEFKSDYRKRYGTEPKLT